MLRVGGSTATQRRARLAAALEALPPALRDRRRARAGQLSGGQQRLVAVAGAIAASPRLLLADEPALGLSPVAASEVYAALVAARSVATAMVIVETRLDRVEGLCERAVVLDGGRVAYDGPIGNADAIAAALLGERAAVSPVPTQTAPTTDGGVAPTGEPSGSSWGERGDLNPRPPGPQPGALTS